MELLRLGPTLIGATGGSGTRAVAAVVRRAGLYIGSNLNESVDAIDFGGYSDRWINRYTPFRDGVLPPEIEREMVADLRDVLGRHVAEIEGLPRSWGWKEPRCIYLLPFFHRHLPAVRFLHVVRDGRDMALSVNQNQLSKHGQVIGLPRLELSPPAQSITLWAWINGVTARYGREHLDGNYLRVRFENLCRDPVATTRDIFGFIGLDADPNIGADEVASPDSLGRWRHADPEVIAELQEIAGATLVELGYELL